MRVVWFIYGDVFAHHPDLTIGTLSNGSRTQLQYNTVKDAGSDSFPGTSINPLGMSDNVSNWTNAPFRIVDFGSDDMSGWNGDIYIDTGDVDADGANFDQDVQVELHGNRARGSSTLQTDFEVVPIGSVQMMHQTAGTVMILKTAHQRLLGRNSFRR